MIALKSDTNQAGCTPVSSNCVIWTGPDIPCIQLCKGDSISDVTAKLAQQLCDLLTQVNITNFSTALLCFDPICPVLTNLEDLINFIINELCVIKNLPSPTPSSGCPDCLVTVAPCFQTHTPEGDLVTQMQLVAYAQVIGIQVCTLITDINTINATLIAYNIRITDLEDATPPPAYEPPLIPASCLSVTSTDPYTAINIINTSLCNLLSATGTPTQLLASIAGPCPSNLNTQPSLANPLVNMGSLPGWVVSPTDLADSVTNLWITICDLRAATANLALCCNSGCNALIVNMIATISSGVITVIFSGTVPPGFIDAGSTIIVSDISGNTQTVTSVPVLNDITGSINYTITLNGYMNATSNITLELFGNFTNPATGVTCQKQLTFVIVSPLVCPILTLTPTTTTIGYSFPTTLAIGSYIVQLWLGGVEVQANNACNQVGPGTVTGTFTGLIPSSAYSVRINVGVGAVCNVENPYCAFVPVSTPHLLT